MYVAIIVIFCLGYSAIALEREIGLDKAASALFTAVVCWILLVVGRETLFNMHADQSMHLISESITHHLGEIGEILFFLLGAMTVVELVDAHGGFDLITDRIRTTNKSKLLWVLSIVTFFMSAVLDNLTTTIVMAALLRKLIAKKEALWMFGGMLVLAANAGGAWSPIGDVTTIMLWIGGQVTAPNIVVRLILPSLAALIVPLIAFSMTAKGDIEPVVRASVNNGISTREKRIILALGVLALLMVPVFKTLTHLPPFMGILLGVSILWGVTELMHRDKEMQVKTPLSITGVLQRVDTPTILFFLGILLAVSALQTGGHLSDFATALDQKIGNIWVINGLIGLLSAIVDNVPLVAGAMGMYSMELYPQDHMFWELLAYCAGTGGSGLIIGSAAGVAMMGILGIDFIWYLRRITLFAILGYFSGILVLLLQYWLGT